MAKRLEWKVSFQRNNKFPLDFDSVFSSKTAAEEYVINSSSSAHIGQIIAVTGETGSVIYKVDKLGVASGLTELTADVYNKSEIDTMISNAGKVKDVKVNGTTVVGADGVATITLPTVDDALNGSSVNAVQNKVITNKFSDYYSKSEVDSKISSAVSNVELFEFVDSLPSSGKTNLIYVAPNTGATGETNTYVEYIYKTDGTWEKVGEFKADTDLSNFYTKGESDSKYQVKGNY